MKKKNSKRIKMAIAVSYIVSGAMLLFASVYGIGKMILGMEELFYLGGEFAWKNYALTIGLYILLIVLACVSMIVINMGTRYIGARIKLKQMERKR